MLLALGGHIINTAQVIRFEAVNQGLSREQTLVHFTDGSTLKVNANYDQIAQHEGTILPAPTGFSVIEMIQTNRKVEKMVVLRDPVVAFRVTTDIDMPIQPITLKGEPHHNFVIVEPSGRCVGPDGIFDTVGEWQESIAAGVPDAVA